MSLAAADLREDGEALLGLVVAGQARAEDTHRLGGAVDLGDEVRADLVLDEGVGPRDLDGGVGVDEQGVAAHHDAVDVVAHLGVDVDLGVDLAVVVDLGLREGEERGGVEALTRTLAAVDPLEDALGLGLRLRRGRAVEPGCSGR